MNIFMKLAHLIIVLLFNRIINCIKGQWYFPWDSSNNRNSQHVTQGIEAINYFIL